MSNGLILNKALDFLDRRSLLAVSEICSLLKHIVEQYFPVKPYLVLRKLRFYEYKWSVSIDSHPKIYIKSEADPLMDILKEQKFLRAKQTELLFIVPEENPRVTLFYESEDEEESEKYYVLPQQSAPDEDALFHTLESLSHIWTERKLTLDFSLYWYQSKVPDHLFANCRELNLQSFRQLGYGASQISDSIDLPALITNCTAMRKCVKISYYQYGSEEVPPMEEFADWISKGIPGETKFLFFDGGLIAMDNIELMMTNFLKEKFLEAKQPAPFVFECENVTEPFQLENTSTQEVLVGKRLTTYRRNCVIIRRKVDTPEIDTWNIAEIVNDCPAMLIRTNRLFVCENAAKYLVHYMRSRRLKSSLIGQLKSMSNAQPSELDQNKRESTLQSFSSQFIGDKQVAGISGNFSAGQQIKEQKHKHSFQIYIGELTEDITEDTLRAFYSRFGNVCRIAFTNLTSPSLAYPTICAYVTFTSQDEINRAIASQPHIINGIKISARIKEKEKFNPNCAVHVYRLPPFVDDSSLRKYYSQFGTVEKCERKVDIVTNAPKDRAIIIFSNESERENSMRVVPHIIDGARVVASRYTHVNPEAFKEKEYEAQHQIYVGELTEDTTEDSLHAFYSKFGKIRRINFIRKDVLGGYPAIYAFIALSSQEEVESVIASQPHVINGIKINAQCVDQAESELRQREGCTIYIDRLPPHIGENAVRRFYSRFGTVEKCEILVDFLSKTHIERALVHFSKQHEVINALKALPHVIEGAWVDANAYRQGRQTPFSMSEISLEHNTNFRNNNTTRQRPQRRADHKERTLIVSGLSNNFTAESLCNFYSRFGLIIKCEIRRAQRDSNSLFGIVTFLDKTSAIKALNAERPRINGRTMSVKLESDSRTEECAQTKLKQYMSNKNA
ncbi:RNA recognition motif domain-containing protein [Ditylenchus destructor]|nr:RNA recognition motif domain-containing protein [Ditylenchus destructor]